MSNTETSGITGYRYETQRPFSQRPFDYGSGINSIVSLDAETEDDECDNAKIDLSDDDEEMEMSGEVPSGEPITAASVKVFLSSRRHVEDTFGNCNQHVSDISEHQSNVEETELYTLLRIIRGSDDYDKKIIVYD
eukprot:g66195.t1